MSEILLSGIAEHMLLKNIHIHTSVIKLVILERFELHFFCPTIMQGVDKENFPVFYKNQNAICNSPCEKIAA